MLPERSHRPSEHKISSEKQRSNVARMTDTQMGGATRAAGPMREKSITGRVLGEFCPNGRPNYRRKSEGARGAPSGLSSVMGIFCKNGSSGIKKTLKNRSNEANKTVLRNAKHCLNISSIQKEISLAQSTERARVPKRHSHCLTPMGVKSKPRCGC